MLTWLAKRIAARIDLDTLANKVGVKLAARLDERLNSKLRKEALKGALKARLANPSKIVYAITGEKFPLSGPYYLKEDPTYRCTFRKGDTAPIIKSARRSCKSPGSSICQRKTESNERHSRPGNSSF